MKKSNRYVLLSIAVALCLAFAAAHAGEDATWQKIETTEQVLREIDQVLTPGLFNQSQVALVTFPANGAVIELPLPHEGNDAQGNPRFALKGALRQNAIWLDLDGDGKPGNRELTAVTQAGTTAAFSFPTGYADGTSGTYTFKLQTAKKPGEFRIVRCCARVARVDKKHTIVLIDDNGNGLYNDIGQDALLIDQQPVTFLGRQIYLDSELYELLVHPGGTTIEIRPMAHYQVGTVDLFKSYTYPQKAENLRIHTVIVQGAETSFSFSPQFASRPLPTGAYDLTFALFERSTERVYMLKGTKTSFTVEANQETSPKWGAPIELRFNVDSDGRHVTLSPPTFFGVAGENYIPADLQKIPFYGAINIVDRNRRNPRNPVQTTPQDSRFMMKYTYEPNGDVKPLVFEQLKSEQLDADVDYKSGILGPVHGEQSINFVAKRGK